MKPILDNQRAQAEAQTQWEQVIKSAKAEAEHIKGTFGKIYVPKDMIEDYPVPAQFKSSYKNKNTDDIFSFADQMGFSNPHEATQYLRQLDNHTKVKLKDLMPNDTKAYSEQELVDLERSLRNEFAQSEGGKSIDNLLADLLNIHSETASGLSKEIPLNFKSEKIFKVDKNPISYTGRMDPKDQSAIKSEGSYSTRYTESPSGDTLKIYPERPVEFKTTGEVPRERAFKKTIKVLRDTLVEDAKFVDSPSNFKDVLASDPRIAEAIQKLNDLAPGAKNLKPINGDFGQADTGNRRDS
jgi:hypothetical protein